MALRIGQASGMATGERWVAFQSDVDFKIAGIDCDAYQIALERARRLIARADAGQTLDKIVVDGADRKEHDVQCELLGRYIIRDWKGAIEDESGATVSYSPEAAARLLKGSIDLFVWVMREAAQISIEENREVAETVEKP